MRDLLTFKKPVFLLYILCFCQNEREKHFTFHLHDLNECDWEDDYATIEVLRDLNKTLIVESLEDTTDDGTIRQTYHNVAGLDGRVQYVQVTYTIPMTTTAATTTVPPGPLSTESTNASPPAAAKLHPFAAACAVVSFLIINMLPKMYVD